MATVAKQPVVTEALDVFLLDAEKVHQGVVVVDLAMSLAEVSIVLFDQRYELNRCFLGERILQFVFHFKIRLWAHIHYVQLIDALPGYSPAC